MDPISFKQNLLRWVNGYYGSYAFVFMEELCLVVFFWSDTTCEGQRQSISTCCWHSQSHANRRTSQLLWCNFSSQHLFKQINLLISPLFWGVCIFAMLCSQLNFYLLLQMGVPEINTVILLDREVGCLSICTFACDYGKSCRHKHT